MSDTAQDELIKLRNEGGVVVAKVVNGTFREEKKILSALERLGGIIDSRSKVHMVLDMENVEYLSSAGLGRLVALLKKSKAGGGCLHLAAMSKEIHELFEVMRLGQIFKIFDAVDQAVAEFD